MMLRLRDARRVHTRNLGLSSRIGEDLSLKGGVPVSRWVKWGRLRQAEEQHHVRQRYKGPWCDWETFKRPVALG